MPRIVSMKPAVVHSPTIAPNHKQVAGARREHVGDRLAQHLADVGRHGRRNASSVLMPSALRPTSWAIAAATMKNGNSVTSDR